MWRRAPVVLVAPLSSPQLERQLNCPPVTFKLIQGRRLGAPSTLARQLNWSNCIALYIFQCDKSSLFERVQLWYLEERKERNQEGGVPATRELRFYLSLRGYVEAVGREALHLIYIDDHYGWGAKDRTSGRERLRWRSLPDC